MWPRISLFPSPPGFLHAQAVYFFFMPNLLPTLFSSDSDRFPFSMCSETSPFCGSAAHSHLNSSFFLIDLPVLFVFRFFFNLIRSRRYLFSSCPCVWQSIFIFSLFPLFPSTDQRSPPPLFCVNFVSETLFYPCSFGLCFRFLQFPRFFHVLICASLRPPPFAPSMTFLFGFPYTSSHSRPFCFPISPITGFPFLSHLIRRLYPSPD